MAIKQITYFIDGKKKTIDAKICDTIWSKFFGLMFRRRSPPLLFIFSKNKKLAIHSLFCKPFKAIWLDDKMHLVKISEVNNWKLNISGNGRYLLEIPLSFRNSKIPTTKPIEANRNI